MRYDPEKPLPPHVWLELDEQERLSMISRHHRSRRCTHPRAENQVAHDLIHVIVENQAASADVPVAEVLTRLVDEGLSRHDAVHAVGRVLASYLTTASTDGKPAPDFDQYFAELRTLTAESWLRSADEDDGSSATDEDEAPTLGTVLALHRAAMASWQVEALFLGAIASTNGALAPPHLIPLMFDEKPPFETLEDAQTFFTALMTSWNELVGRTMSGDRLTLSPILLSSRPSRAAVRDYAARREEELRCFVLGFDAGGDDPVAFGSRGPALFRRLAEARDLYRQMTEPPIAKETPEQRAEAARRLLDLTASVETMLADILEVGRTVRGQAIAAYDEISERGETDDGVPIGGAKVGRNAACPCGSGRKYKKCCGRGGSMQ